MDRNRPTEIVSPNEYARRTQHKHRGKIGRILASLMAFATMGSPTLSIPRSYARRHYRNPAAKGPHSHAQEIARRKRQIEKAPQKLQTLGPLARGMASQ